MTTQAALAARLDRAARIIRGEVAASKRKERKARRAFSRALAGMDIPTYVAWLNDPADSFALTDDVAHWAQIGITNAAQLGDYLNGCVRREMEKDARNGYCDDAFDDYAERGGYGGGDDGEGYTFDRDRAEGIAADKAKRDAMHEDMPF
ncbi:hypothetical protein HOU00_gp127 [Caulobacter phage CcrPW]|uniref:Uncharacterized protein n=1 Tax=Caulobacter phage CcrPW TaxID=2283271 RepID=A0A385ECT0_9CAUD|nr:hypothetical protein HOU00_gp009 [Caulobacter phage CcrPW]YP_009809628.1 hypothetical protein HOU00_gp127 [Caulobacter phage CcrPW]AXQ68548.1 hypothetical protein CcrPW_gp009 [Caulobacter phage CcrPW]AXQ68998.1 hypothetical protein CcrPW_gp459 [Caulobacter phage CcrPW]